LFGVKYIFDFDNDMYFRVNRILFLWKWKILSSWWHKIYRRTIKKWNSL